MWDKREQALMEGLRTPQLVQAYLDSIVYNSGPYDIDCMSPRLVMQKQKAHCMEGALFAAAAFDFHGRAPLLLDLRAVNDDDHVIAIFQEHNLWGAVAKSNTSALRYREPVYATLRELVMSYFDFYCNDKGEKTLREYSIPYYLDVHGKRWKTTTEDLSWIGEDLDKIAHIQLLKSSSIEKLSLVDKRLQEAILLGADEKGLYKSI